MVTVLTDLYHHCSFAHDFGRIDVLTLRFIALFVKQMMFIWIASWVHTVFLISYLPAVCMDLYVHFFKRVNHALLGFIFWYSFCLALLCLTCSATCTAVTLCCKTSQKQVAYNLGAMVYLHMIIKPVRTSYLEQAAVHTMDPAIRAALIRFLLH